MKILENNSHATILVQLLMVALFFGSCKNDDNGAQLYEAAEEEEEIIVAPQGLITVTTSKKQLKIGLNDGSVLEETLFGENEKVRTHQEDVYEFKTNTIVKKAANNGAVVWEKTYREEVGKSIRMHQAHTAFSQNTLFISYQELDTNTYESSYFMEALDLESSNTIWRLNVGARTFPYLYENRLITVQYPNGNAPTTFQYRNKVLGDVEVERMIPERVDDYTFDGDLIIANSWNDRVFALDRGLNTVWSFSTEAENPGDGLIFEDQYLFFSRDRHVYSLNKNTGVLNWETAVSERLFMGLHTHGGDLYLAQQTGTQTLTLNKINTENGELTTSFETPMSDDSYTTKLAFYKEYMLVAMAPSSDENNPQIEARLIHLPTKKEVWTTDLSFRMTFYKTTTVHPSSL